MRADRAVEPTKSENITVTWRRSAVSRKDASTAAGRLGPMPLKCAPVHFLRLSWKRLKHFIHRFWHRSTLALIDTLDRPA